MHCSGSKDFVLIVDLRALSGTASGLVIAAVACGCSSAPGVDPTPPPCVQSSAEHDDFEQATASPCSWGQLTQLDCTVTVTNGELTMAAKPGASAANCICGAVYRRPFTSTFGVIAEVLAVGAEVGEESMLVALASIEGWHIGYDPAMSMLYFEHERAGAGRTRLGYVPWDPATRWWRIRPDVAGTAIIGEVSQDGENWTLIAIEETSPPEMILPSFMTMTSQPVAAPSTVRLGSFNLCP